MARSAWCIGIALAIPRAQPVGSGGMKLASAPGAAGAIDSQPTTGLTSLAVSTKSSLIAAVPHHAAAARS